MLTSSKKTPKPKPSSLLNQCKCQMVSEVIGLWLTFTEEKSCTASALPASHHLFQPSSRTIHPATELIQENMTVPESIQFSWHLHLNPPLMGSLICLPDLKQLRCRHVLSCYLHHEVQEKGSWHTEAALTHNSNAAKPIYHRSGTCEACAFI